MKSAQRNVLLIFMLACSCCGFLLHNDTDCTCVAPKPCACSDSSRVECDSRGLSSIPMLRTPCSKPAHSQSVIVNFNSNGISRIQDGVLQSLNDTNSDYVQLFLENNVISNIDDSAFSGIEDKVINLQLQNNSLTQLPLALGKLTNLKVLVLTHNHIHSFSQDVLSKIGSSLDILSVDLKGIKTWPHSFGSLVNLHKLQISHMDSADTLGPGAFTNMTKLNSLVFYYSNFSQIPSSFCELHELTRLHMSFNQPMSSLVWPCKHPLVNLHTLAVAHSNVTSVPDITKLATSLYSLALSSSPITSFTVNDTGRSTSLTTLDLTNCTLASFPDGIKQFPSLVRLFLHGNAITNVPSGIFGNMANIRSIDLSKNSIHTLDDSAFDGVSSLGYINLSDNGLFSFPTAIKGLTNNNLVINLQGNYIACDCSMKWILSWKAQRHVNILGSCIDFAGTIMDYINKELAKC